MKPIYSISFFVLLFSITLLVFGGCQKEPTEEIEKAPPPTPRPVFGANTNPLPPGVQGTTPDWSVTGKLPRTLVCGQQYEVEAITQEVGVQCSGYNYTSLYNRAHNIAYRRIYPSLGGRSSVSCPQACSPVHSWQIDRKWSCLLGTAEAHVKYGVLCPNPGQQRPAHAPFSTPPVPSLSSGAPYIPTTFPTGSPGDSIKEKNDGSSGLTNAACPSIDPIYIKYSESVQSCQNLNYAPFIKRAEDWAKLNYKTQSCKTPCRKQAFSVRNRRWNCGGPPRKVDVDIIFNLNCQRP